MTLSTLPDQTLDTLWHRVQSKKYRYGICYDLAYRCQRIQHRIDKESFIRELRGMRT